MTTPTAAAIERAEGALVDDYGPLPGVAPVEIKAADLRLILCALSEAREVVGPFARYGAAIGYGPERDGEPFSGWDDEELFFGAFRRAAAWAASVGEKG